MTQVIPNAVKGAGPNAHPLGATGNYAVIYKAIEEVTRVDWAGPFRSDSARAWGSSGRWTSMPSRRLTPPASSSS
jgi:hypothetical protein